MNVLVAVTSEVTLSPGIGWVRGDQAIDPKILQESERLRTRNAELEKQLDAASSSAVTFPSNLPSPGSEVAITVIARRANEKDANYVYSTTWKHIFLDAMDDILNEKYEAEISYSLGMKYGEILLRKVYTASLPSDQIRTIRIQLEALGLIKAIATTRQSDGETRLGTSWVITDKGRRYMVENLALKTDPTHSA